MGVLGASWGVLGAPGGVPGGPWELLGGPWGGPGGSQGGRFLTWGGPWAPGGGPWGSPGGPWGSPKGVWGGLGGAFGVSGTQKQQKPMLFEGGPWGAWGVLGGVWGGPKRRNRLPQNLFGHLGPSRGAQRQPKTSLSGLESPPGAALNPRGGGKTPLVPSWASLGHFSRFLKSSKKHWKYVYLGHRGTPGPPHEGPWGSHGGARASPG